VTKIKYISLILFLIIFSCKEKQIEKHDSKTYKISNRFKIKINNKNLSILDSKGKIVFVNDKIIRLKDENQQCMSQGFQNIVSKGDFFTVEQQNCSNKYIIGEYITFKYNKTAENYFLSKIGYIYIDKQNPDNKKEDKIFTPIDFGNIKLENVDIALLYVDLINK